MFLLSSLRAKGEAIRSRLAYGLPRALWALAMTFILAGPAQAQQACTEMWCAEGLTVYLEGMVWPPGKYEFMIEADEEVIFCEGRMPFSSCGQNAACDREGVTIGEYGCALQKELHAFSTISLQEIPEKIAVHIKQDKGWFSSGTVSVKPQCGFPNGEACDPRPCCSASVSMPVEWTFRKEVAQ